MPQLFAGNANFSTIIFADYTNFYAGVNTTTPNNTLTVNGNAYISQNLTAGNNLFISQFATIGQNLSASNINVSGNIDVANLVLLNGVQFDRIASNPGNADTLWVNTSGALFLGNNLINFTGPTGTTGATGATGPTGITGSTGTTGPTGLAQQAILAQQVQLVQPAQQVQLVQLVQ